MYIKYPAKANDNFFSKNTINKQMIDRFFFEFVETSSIRAMPSLLTQVVLGIYFPFYSQPNKFFYFLRKVKLPNLSEKYSGVPGENFLIL